MVKPLFEALPMEVIYRILDIVHARNPFDVLTLCLVCKTLLRIVQMGTLTTHNPLKDGKPVVKPLLYDVFPLGEPTWIEYDGFWHLRLSACTPRVIIYRAGLRSQESLEWFNTVYEELVIKEHTHATVFRVLNTRAASWSDTLAQMTLPEPWAADIEQKTQYIDITVFETDADEVLYLKTCREEPGLFHLLGYLMDHYHYFRIMKNVTVLYPIWMFRSKPNTTRTRLGLTAPLLEKFSNFSMTYGHTHLPSPIQQARALAVLFLMDCPKLRELEGVTFLPTLVPFEHFPSLESLKFEREVPDQSESDFDITQLLPAHIRTRLDLTRVAHLPKLEHQLFITSLTYEFDAPRLRRVDLDLDQDKPWMPPERKQLRRWYLPSLKEFRLHFRGRPCAMKKLLERFDPEVWRQLEKLWINVLDDETRSPLEDGTIQMFFEGRVWEQLRTLCVRDEFEGKGWMDWIPIMHSKVTLRAPKLLNLEIITRGFFYCYFVLNERNRDSFKELRHLQVTLDDGMNVSEERVLELLADLPSINHAMFPNVPTDLLDSDKVRTRMTT